MKIFYVFANEVEVISALLIWSILCTVLGYVIGRVI